MTAVLELQNLAAARKPSRNNSAVLSTLLHGNCV